MKYSKELITLAVGYFIWKIYMETNKVSPEYVKRVAKRLAPLFSTNIDPVLVVAMVEQESSFLPKAVRYEPQYKYNILQGVYKGQGDISLGLMQVMTSTAFDLWQKGYTYYGRPTLSNLKNPTISIYFGMAYIDWLQKRMINSGIDTSVLNVSQYYNGGFKNNSEMAKIHAKKILRKYNKYKESLK